MQKAKVYKIDKELEPIFEDFIQERKKDVLQIDQDLANKDYKSLKSVGHKLAGNAGSYGLHELGDFGKQLEETAAAENEAEVSKVCDEIKNIILNLEIEFV